MWSEHCLFDIESKEYRKPYIVQRMSFRKEPRAVPTSFDDLLKMDYMGYAEYEFGAMPMSLKRVCKDIEIRKIFEFKDIIDYKGDSLVILARTEEEAVEYSEWVQKMCEDEYGVRLKERARIYGHMPHEAPYVGKDPIMFQSVIDKCKYDREAVDAWWDLRLDTIFCFGKKKLKKILASIVVLKAKQKEAGAEGWY
jgi:hypothetical protein